MTAQTEFILKMFATLTVAAICWLLMVRAQKKKQDQADADFEWTMKAIEMRNKKVDNNDTKNS